MNKPFKYLLIAFLAIVTVSSCAVGSRNGTGGEVTGVSGTSWTEPTPYGMVLIDRGSIKMGPSKADSAWNLRADARGISVDGFWMDETEVTNSKYKQFVFWVRDSIGSCPREPVPYKPNHRCKGARSRTADLPLRDIQPHRSRKA